jgi:Platelet-activating factor acetylhydrolase, isoform II
MVVAPDGSTSPAPPDVAGCGSTNLYQVDATNTGAAGPWVVGVKTIQVAVTGGSITTEVWYPAPLGSSAGQTETTYNLLDYFPASQAALVPASANKIIRCSDFPGGPACYRDLPIDSSHGPYPLAVFIHGTGSFRYASMSTMVQWASRGFVVVAADHPGLYLVDFLSDGGTTACPDTGLGQNLSRDVMAEIAAVTNKTGGYSFLGNSVDVSRIGMSGHSQGAENAASFASMMNVQVDMPLADLGGQTASGASLKSVLVGGGLSDSVVSYSSDMSAYTGSTAAIKRLVGITNGDHLDVTDLCWEKNPAGLTGIQVADQYGVCSGAGLAALNALAKCGTVMPPTAGPGVINYATTAALEETLHCQDRSAAFSNLKTAWSQVGDYEHTP